MESAADIGEIDPLAPPPGPAEVVIGCGNLLRGDDAAGPVLIRMLWERGLGETVRLVDGGTAGMDVAFKMRGARRVILIDACTGTGEPAGTLFRVPGDVIAAIEPPTEIHSHAFRWDHALSFARWLLKDEYPQDVQVWLVEGASFDHGAELTDPVRAALEELCLRIEDDLAADSRPDRPSP